MSLFTGVPKNLDAYKIVATRKYDKKNKLIYLKTDVTDQKIPNLRVITGGEFTPCPDVHSREVYFVAGPSGAGKSYFTNKYVYQYMKMFPDHPVFVFSKFKKDVSCSYFDEDNVTIIPNDEIDDDFEEQYPNEVFANSLVIFDDVDSIREEVREKIYEIMHRLLESGRHKNTYMVITGHNLFNYKKTRELLNECTHSVFFPNSNFYQVKSYLTRYIGMSKKQIEEIRDLKTRWVCIRKHYPTTIIYESGIYLL